MMVVHVLSAITLAAAVASADSLWSLRSCLYATRIS
jgi:hypothetical protein